MPAAFPATAGDPAFSFYLNGKPKDEDGIGSVKPREAHEMDQLPSNPTWESDNKLWVGQAITTKHTTFIAAIIAQWWCPDHQLALKTRSTFHLDKPLN